MNEEIAERIAHLRNDKSIKVLSIGLRKDFHKSVIKNLRKGVRGRGMLECRQLIQMFYQYKVINPHTQNPYFVSENIFFEQSDIPVDDQGVEDYNFFLSYVEDWLGVSIEEFTEGSFHYV
jgi:hypothetical protein